MDTSWYHDLETQNTRKRKASSSSALAPDRERLDDSDVVSNYRKRTVDIKTIVLIGVVCLVALISIGRAAI